MVPLEVHNLMSFITFIKFLVIISSDIVSAPLSLSSLSGIFNACMLDLFTIFFLSLILVSEFYIFSLVLIFSNHYSLHIYQIFC